MERQEAEALVRALRLRLRNRGRSQASRLRVVGGLRRGKAVVKDVDLLYVIPDDSPLTLGGLTLADGGSPTLKAVQVVNSGDRRRTFTVCFRGKIRQVDLFQAYQSELPFALYHHTGSSTYNIRLRAHAKARGWKLNQYGLFYRSDGKKVRGTGRIRSERSLARFLGVAYRAPEDREE